MSLLTIKHLHKTFKQDNVHVARDINLSIKQGEIFTLMGKSGCGKSSLLRMICGFETPDKGTIILDDTPLFAKGTNLEPKQRRVAMVFQNYALFPHLSVEKNILLGFEKEGKDRLDDLLEKTGISAIKKRYPHEISGGQQQRVALCRALIRQPLVLLLDEPFSSVDSQMRIRLRQELKKMIKSFGITSIFVTHDKEDAFYMSDRAALMQEGAILQTGDVKTLYQAPCSKDAAGFLGAFNTLRLPEGETISFRPGDVALTSGGTHAGVVTESCFYGFFYQNGIRIYEQDITLFSPAPLQPGQKVSFDITRMIPL